MLNPRHQPFHLLFWMAVIFLPASVCFSGLDYDFHFHDTYMNIMASQFYLSLAAFLFLIWIVHSLTKKILYSRILTLVQLILIMTGTILLTAFTWNYRAQGLSGNPRRYYDRDFMFIFNQSGQSGFMIQIAILILILGILLFSFNIMAGLVKKVLFPD